MLMCYRSAILFLFSGVGSTFWQPVAMKIGRRPVYIMGLLLALVGSIMGAVQTKWGVWVAFNVFWVCPLTFGVNCVDR